MKGKWKWILLVFILLFLVGIIISFLGNSPSDSKLTGDDYLPVNAQPSSNIKFSAEKIKPELTGQDYFVNYRLERDRFRQETKQMLAVLLDSKIGETQLQAQQKWLALSQSIKLEGEIESVLKIKGFADVVSNVNSDSVNIIILAPSIKPEQVYLIQDVVLQITGRSIDKINISTRK